MDAGRITWWMAALLALLPAMGDRVVASQATSLQTIPVTGWCYTTERPVDGWDGPAFNEAGWREGTPGFGNQALPPGQQARVKTEWTTPDLWVRARFRLEQVPERLALHVSHDEEVEVYLNGTRVCARKGYVTDYVLVPLDGEARSAVREGWNVLAAHCRQTAGGQFLDVQVAEVVPPPRRSVEEILRELGPVPRPEHPRPDRIRAVWHNLNGAWEFAFDPEDAGLKEGWSDGRPLKERIVVPFCPESQLSGVFDEGIHPICWYARTFDLPEKMRGRRTLLHFGAVDYRAEVWLNGKRLGSHEGGYDPFQLDVTDALRPTGNRLVVRAQDDPHEAKPRGKQSAARYPSGCEYMRVTGIWQTVWLEAVGAIYLRDWVIRADPDTGRVTVQVTADGPGDGLQVSASLLDAGRDAGRAATPLRDGAVKLALNAVKPRLWSPETPHLYDLELVLAGPGGEEVDRVRTYLGFRKVETRDGMYHLNGKPFFLLSALDQGYYPEGLYTAPSDEALRADVEWARRYGLNNVRKHQLVAEPRFLYWCDRLGLTVWGEMADWGSPLDDRFLRQWSACLRRDVNHPCIITWVPTNEQKAPEDDQANATKVRLYRATRELDPTRPVIDTSGYCHTETDIADLHVNPRDGADCRRWWGSWRKAIAESGNFPAYPDRPAYCKGFRHQGQPIIFSETGNWRITELPPMGVWTAYGYGPVATVADYLALYRDFFLALMSEPECAGFSYVQLYDVEGEVNGYLTYDRKPKVDPEEIVAVHAEGLRLRRER